ncbi:MAG: hypothetical protein R3C53_23475 [Pirellulaceae bacterium]
MISSNLRRALVLEQLETRRLLAVDPPIWVPHPQSDSGHSDRPADVARSPVDRPTHGQARSDLNDHRRSDRAPSMAKPARQLPSEVLAPPLLVQVRVSPSQNLLPNPQPSSILLSASSSESPSSTLVPRSPILSQLQSNSNAGLTPIANSDISAGVVPIRISSPSVPIVSTPEDDSTERDNRSASRIVAWRTEEPNSTTDQPAATTNTKTEENTDRNRRTELSVDSAILEFDLEIIDNFPLIRSQAISTPTVARDTHAPQSCGWSSDQLHRLRMTAATANTAQNTRPRADLAARHFESAMHGLIALQYPHALLQPGVSPGWVHVGLEMTSGLHRSLELISNPKNSQIPPDMRAAVLDALLGDAVAQDDSEEANSEPVYRISFASSAIVASVAIMVGRLAIAKRRHQQFVNLKACQLDN